MGYEGRGSGGVRVDGRRVCRVACVVGFTEESGALDREIDDGYAG